MSRSPLPARTKSGVIEPTTPERKFIGVPTKFGPTRNGNFYDPDVAAGGAPASAFWFLTMIAMISV
jgi:hypothetical protein